jgi:hypothetical protein
LLVEFPWIRDPGVTKEGDVFGDGNPAGLDLMDRRKDEWDPLGWHFPYDPLDGQKHVTRVGFVPVGTVGGYGVGAIVRTSTGWPPDPDAPGACPDGTLAAVTADVFASRYGSQETPVWQKHLAKVLQGNGAAVQKPNCQWPPLPAVPDPPALPDLSFQRDYLPAEQERFQQVGVTPPDYTVTLKIQATPTP